MVDEKWVYLQFADYSILKVLRHILGVVVPGVAGSDSSGSLQIVVDFLAVEKGEDMLASRMHEMLIDIVHRVVDNDVPDSFGVVVLELLPAFSQLLIDIVVILSLLVVMPEQTFVDNATRLGTVDDFAHDVENCDPSQAEHPSPEEVVRPFNVHDKSCQCFS